MTSGGPELGGIVYELSCKEGKWRDASSPDTASCPCTQAGDTCPDGSILAGLTPDGDVLMYATPADAPNALSWGSYGTLRGLTNTVTGEANTNALAAFGPTAHPAANYCQTLSAHGHDDWYLPAQQELSVLYSAKNVGTFNGSYNESGSFLAGFYWSSTKGDLKKARGQRFSDGAPLNHVKSYSYKIRCVRK